MSGSGVPKLPSAATRRSASLLPSLWFRHVTVATPALLATTFSSTASLDASPTSRVSTGPSDPFASIQRPFTPEGLNPVRQATNERPADVEATAGWMLYSPGADSVRTGPAFPVTETRRALTTEPSLPTARSQATVVAPEPSTAIGSPDVLSDGAAVMGV